MDFTIAVLAGDGIGPEVVRQGKRLLDTVGRRFGHRFTYQEGLIGGIAIDTQGTALSGETVAMCRGADAVLLGAVGGPKWDDPRAAVRPEDGLLGLRKELRLFANLRPVKCHAELLDSTPLKPHVLEGLDLLIIRELTGGLYFGKPKRRWANARGRQAIDTMAYSDREIARVLRLAFELARGRRRQLTSVDKANVLATSRLWREVATEIGEEYPDVALRHMLVDTCAMQLVRSPRDFDVIVTENTFGDILTDEAAVLAGSMGMLPSASLGGRSLARRWRADSGRAFGLYEPVHGSAPDIAGQDRANPMATILSIAMMLRFSLGLPDEARAVEAAVAAVLASGCRTPDIATAGATVVGTEEMGQRIAGQLTRG
ncbi:MAG: 3-isopropylmalate dehydrogenase [Dehalococcoidia bacterium]